MKAMILRTPKAVEENPLDMVEIATTEPGSDDICIRVDVCGVCHTDLHIAEGELEPKQNRIVPGHQIVGHVETIGKNVTRFKIGDQVGVTWLYSTCGQCDYCTNGKENLCDRPHFTGYHNHGGFAEYTVVPAVFAHLIPKGFPANQAAPLLCAGVIGYRSLKLCEIQPSQRLGLYGFGASAHVTIQVARHWGCEVYVFTRSEEHRKHALELGAVWAGGAEDEPPDKMDSSIIFAPVGTIVPDALRVLRKGGTLAINAVHMSPIPTMPYNLIYFERTVRSVANCTRQDAKEVLQLAAEIPIKTDVEIYNLSEANLVLQKLKKSEIRGAAVLKIDQSNYPSAASSK